MAKVEIYLTQFCPYCTRALQLLDAKGAPYIRIDISDDPGMWGEMTRRSQRHTVPQIFINDVSVGGYDDIALLDHRGELDTLLEHRQETV